MSSITHKVSCQIPNQKNKPSVDAIIEFVQISRQRQYEDGSYKEVVLHRAEGIMCPEYDDVVRKCKITSGTCLYSKFKQF